MGMSDKWTAKSAPTSLRFIPPAGKSGLKEPPMTEIEKKYTIPTSRFTARLYRRWANATGKLNSRKIGRTRRGGWQLSGGGAAHNEDGTTVVTVRLRKAPPRLKVPCAGGVKTFCLYDHDDIGKLLKDLAVAASKV